MIDPKLIPDDVLAVCQRLHEAGHQAHLVGGGIRDLLLGRPPSDFDVATSALPEAVMALFGSRYALPTGLQHGTVTVLAGDRDQPRHVEVTTFRGEGEYLDGRRPSVVHFSATLEEDLAQRVGWAVRRRIGRIRHVHATSHHAAESHRLRGSATRAEVYAQSHPHG